MCSDLPWTLGVSLTLRPGKNFKELCKTKVAKLRESYLNHRDILFQDCEGRIEGMELDGWRNQS